MKILKMDVNYYGRVKSIILGLENGEHTKLVINLRQLGF